MSACSGLGGTVRLAIFAGVKTALDLLLTGRALGPAEALKLGIVDEVVSADALIEAARAWLATGPDPGPAVGPQGVGAAAEEGLYRDHSPKIQRST